MNVISSPFGRVKFTDFFLADIMTSMSNSLNDIVYTIYFLFNFDKMPCLLQDQKTFTVIVATWILSIIPFWFRFWQCIHKYNESKMTVHLKNAFKYFIKVLPFIVIIIYQSRDNLNRVIIDGDNGFNYYLFLNIFATIASSAWDFYYDWGLFRTYDRYNFLLRDKIRFNPSFYYFAIISNLFLRFFWLFLSFGLN